MLDLVKRDGQGALIVVVAQATGDELRATAGLRQKFGLVAVVRVDAGARQAVEVPGSGVSVRCHRASPSPRRGTWPWPRPGAAASAGTGR